jgi:hypothetical protein
MIGSALLSLVLPAFLPAVSDGFRALTTGIAQKFFGGTKPIAVDDQVKLMTAESEKMKALAELDRPIGNPSQWVVDLRASFRYIAAGLIIVGTGCMAGYVVVTGDMTAGSAGVINVCLELCSSVFSFMFGDRVYLNLKKFASETSTNPK